MQDPKEELQKARELQAALKKKKEEDAKKVTVLPTIVIHPARPQPILLCRNLQDSIVLYSDLPVIVAPP